MKRKLAAFAVALAMSVLGLAGAVSATHYQGTQYEETAIRDYEAPSSFGVLAVAIQLDDPVGFTSDGTIDTGGVIFPACAGEDTPGGLRCNKTDDLDGDGDNDTLPGDPQPYDLATVSVSDQVATNVIYDATTCSSDGDSFCGETNNTQGGDQPSTPGPNELAVETCTPKEALLERNPNDPRDGTGAGVWNQTDELYDFDGDGVAGTPHPGVNAVSVFLWDPVNEALFSDDVCNGVAEEPTTGTVEVIGT